MAGSTALTNFLKNKYDKGRIPKQVIEEFPMLNAIPKFSDGGGALFITAVQIGNPQGLGATLAIAQANAQQAGTLADVKGKNWQIPYGDYSGSVNIFDKDMKAAKGNENSFINWFDEQINGIWREFLTHMSWLLFTDGGMSLGTGTISTGVITLANPTDILKFPIGSTIQASANDGTATGHALLGAGSIGYVFAQDEGAGTLTVATSSALALAGTAGTPASWAGTMFLFKQGDFGGTATPNVIFKGFGGWIPAAAPTTGDNWYGIDRSIAPAQLAGFRLLSTDVAGMSIRKRIKKLCAIMNNRGTTPGVTHVALNGEKWQELADELEAQGYRPLEAQNKYGFGANSIALSAGGKIVEVIGDRSVPYGTCFALTMPKDGSNIQMKSIDGFPHIIREDGLEIIRSATANSYEHRIQAYPAFAVKAPGWCGRCPV